MKLEDKTEKNLRKQNYKNTTEKYKKIRALI